MAMPEKPSPNAGRVHLQWNEGWETWQEVLPQYAGEPGVVTFIRADLVDELVKALERAIDAIEGVQRDTYYEFDGDYTPESDRLVPRLRAALTRIKGDGK